ncbi:MAG: hypothetical protein DRZ80_02735 [Thermoprotei archaeon]|nr:MAG: hypothetical protein DRZ80_02735 [Thermoprotei archaeon]
MPYKRKTWREKLEKKMKPKIVNDPKGRGKMLIATPLIVDSLVRKIPKGKLVTTGLLREKLAKDFGADLACPLATGWFIRIVAECAEEDLREGRADLDSIAPYWRILKSDGSLNEKFPGGVKLQAERLKNEGFEIVKKNRKYLVKDYKKYLWIFN